MGLGLDRELVITEETKKEINELLAKNKRKKKTNLFFNFLFFIFVILTFVFNYFEHSHHFIDQVYPLSLGDPSQVIYDNQQNKIEIKLDDEDYYLEKRFYYDVSGLVVGNKPYGKKKMIYDIFPRDIALVWGNNLKNLDGLKSTVIWQYGRFVYARWFTDNGFDMSAIANNHIIPADDKVLDEINRIKEGDQIRLKGYLVDVYDHTSNLILPTSTTRQDSGPGGCEMIYVTEVITNSRPTLNIYMGNLKFVFLLIALVFSVIKIRYLVI